MLEFYETILGHFPDTNHGSCIYSNKYSIQNNEYNNRGSLQAHLKEGLGHCHVLRFQ